MRAERYFFESSFKSDEYQELKGSEFHHLAHVMRARKGDAIELVNGKGALAQAFVQDLTKDKALLKIGKVHQQPEPPCRLILAQAIAKSNRMDFILEKGTELGVDSFWLFPGHHSAKKEYYPSQIEHGRMVTIAAMKQCGRLYLPSMVLQPPIDHWQNLTTMSTFFGDLDPEAPFFQHAWKELTSPTYPILFITGPEGGLSKQEVQSLKNQGALSVKLHDHILRTETASLVALSLLSHWLLILRSD